MWKIFSFIVFCVVSYACFAQDNRIRFYGVEDGLTQSNVDRIAMDNDGFMWLGTQDGLNRFDGYNFKQFKPDVKKKGSIPMPIIRSLIVDKNGGVWIADEHLVKYHSKTEMFESMKLNDTLANLSGEDHVKNLIPDNLGNIYFRKRSSYYYYDAKEDSTFLIQVPQKKHYHSNIKFDKDNTVWSLIEIKNKWYLNSYKLVFDNGYSLEMISSNPVNYNGQDLYQPQYFFDNKGDILVFSKNKLFSFIPETGQFNLLEFSDALNMELLDKKITQFFSDSYGNYWFGLDISSKGGVYRVYNNFNSYEYFDGNTLTQGYEKLTVVNCFTEDYFGNVWLGLSFGVALFNNMHKKFENLIPSSDYPYANISNNIISTAKDDKNRLWLAGENGILVLNEDRTVAHYINDNTHKIDQINFSSVWSMMPYGNGYMALGKMGFVKINPDKNIFQFAHPDKCNLLGWVIWKVYQRPSNGQFWIASHEGLNRVIEKDTTIAGISNSVFLMKEKYINFTYNDGDSSSLISNSIWDLYEDKRNDFWIGTSFGISKYISDSLGFKNYWFDQESITSISHPKIRCFYEDSKSRFWIGTEGGGLNLMDRDKGVFSAIRIKDGLPSDMIWAIEEDTNGNLWLSTSNGLSCFNPDTKAIRNYSLSDGICVNEFTSEGAIKDKDGKIHFAGKGGVVSFYPDDLTDNTIPPKVFINELYLFHKPVAIGEEINGDIVLKQSVLKTKSLQLSYKNNVISIEFVGLHYGAPEKNKYSYILQGFDQEWIEVDAGNRVAHYTNLPYGEYVFKVKAANSDGVWSKEAASMVLVKILPPFWKTLVFRLALVLVIIAGLWFLYHSRVKSLQRKKNELEKEVLKRTEEIHSKNEELTQQAEQLQNSYLTLEEQKNEIEAQSEELMATMEELYNANQQLEKLNVTKDKFFKIIAHDLKNPFHAISGFASILNKSYDVIDDEKKRKFISMIEVSSKSASSLLENLLAWSRTQTEGLKVNPKTFNVKEVMQETLNLLAINASKKNVALHQEIPGTHSVYADVNMFITVMRNLISNAIKFTPENGKITIKSSLQDNNCIITVADTGVGISSEIIDKLFKIEMYTSTKGTSGESGTGLGLIVCKEFTEKNGGEIWVESVLGKGSTFYISLPKK